MKRASLSREKRRKLITAIIRDHPISTQAELVTELSKHGVSVTQATLSRDMRELGLAKFRNKDGIFYAIYNQQQNTSNFTTVYRQFILSVDSVMFMIVCHTRLGEAALLANEFDTAKRPEVLGTIAGADTLLLVCESVKSADSLFGEICDAVK
ncbi:MAG: arginine repressor [Streptococcaceae bacterium]|jgi:transcriptional regulator of arginine metabolism|nr:arginine repressor [Streptococcaceae bacterium]